MNNQLLRDSFPRHVQQTETVTVPWSLLYCCFWLYSGYIDKMHAWNCKILPVPETVQALFNIIHRILSHNFQHVHVSLKIKFKNVWISTLVDKKTNRQLIGKKPRSLYSQEVNLLIYGFKTFSRPNMIVLLVHVHMNDWCSQQFHVYLQLTPRPKCVKYYDPTFIKDKNKKKYVEKCTAPWTWKLGVTQVLKL